MLVQIQNPIADWLLPNRCLVCAIDLSSDTICAPCRSFCHTYPKKILDKQNHIGVFWFELTIKNIIKRAKFNGNTLHIHVLNKLLEEEITEFLPEIKSFAPDVISFVPYHWLHRMLRGAELPAYFAHFLSKKLDIPVVAMFEKTSVFYRQALQKSKKTRQEYIKNAFRLKKDIQLKRVLLVDDIVTTGATFNEIKKLLIHSEVRCLAIAKTP